MKETEDEYEITYFKKVIENSKESEELSENQSADFKSLIDYQEYEFVENAEN